MKRVAIIGFVAAAIIIGVGAVVHERAAAPGGKPAGKSDAAQPAKPAYNKTAYSTTDPASIWVIVNKQHPLDPKTYAPSDLVSVGNGQYMRAEAAAALSTMLAGAKAAGNTVTAGSGYRSYDLQISVYNSEVRAYGQATADTESARPGYSEHQTGWAVDLNSGGCNIADCFANTPGGKWIRANAYKYGFIVRYPDDLTDITGYRAEAWHYRYVGISLATEMHTEGVRTLEQFFNVSGGTTYR